MKDFDVIVATTMNGVIGDSKSNNIPWHLPSDLQYFKVKTLGKTIVMGSATWASLPFRPLKGRRNVVISRKEIGFVGADAQYTSLEEALLKEDNVVVIGGGQIYEECFKFHPKNLFITVVNTSVIQGDVKFPIAGDKLHSTPFPVGSFRHKDDYFMNTYRSEKQVEDKMEFYFTEWTRIDAGMKMSSDAFTFESVQDENGITTTLTKVETGETKTFFKAAGSVEGIQSHMNTLTDELCDQWFAQKKKGKKKNG